MVGNVEIPIWGFGEPELRTMKAEKNVKEITFFKVGTADFFW